MLGATTGASADAVQGAIAIFPGPRCRAGSTLRANEYEADRVGTAFAAAGFDPNSMADLFDSMGRRSVLPAAASPEFLQTHPVTSNRIAGGQGACGPTACHGRAGVGELRFDARTVAGDWRRVRLGRSAYYAMRSQAQPPNAAERYGMAIANLRLGDADTAAMELTQLAAQYPHFMPAIYAARGRRNSPLATSAVRWQPLSAHWRCHPGTSR
ncbi:MAG: M48 family metalloprotease [Proteobacteria bacterium]|nr:M48 family metalloprotease [Pseudomonadota bacterium]